MADSCPLGGGTMAASGCEMHLVRFGSRWILFVVTGACAAEERAAAMKDAGSAPRPALSAPPPDAATTHGARDAAPASRADGGVGAGCDVDTECESGLACGRDLPGGYCTKSCGRDPGDPNSIPPDCGRGATCMTTTLAGSAGGAAGGITNASCYRVCTSSAECRTNEGYDCIVGPFGVRLCLP